eukprot:COSAG05_NODE_2787_length_2637_cov_3.835697_4_plen_202_part_01
MPCTLRFWGQGLFSASGAIECRLREASRVKTWCRRPRRRDSHLPRGPGEYGGYRRRSRCHLGFGAAGADILFSWVGNMAPLALQHNVLREFYCAARKKAGVEAPSIAVNWSPWYEYFPGNDPTVTGAAEAKEMSYYRAKLTELQKWLGPANQKLVTAFLIDEEKWDAGVGPAATVKAATRKANLVYNATMAAFPGVRYEMYN